MRAIIYEKQTENREKNARPEQTFIEVAPSVRIHIPCQAARILVRVPVTTYRIYCYGAWMYREIIIY